MLPNFLVIGAMKSGTDSLYQYLRAHPQVFMPDWKEPHYFTEELNWPRGRRWYEALFDGAGGALAIGEASTTYTKYPTHKGIPERIASAIPRVRLIYLIRHPIDRLRSQYLHEVLLGTEHDPIEKAVVTQPRYLDYSRYALQISEFMKVFSPDQLLVITSESLRHSRRETLRRVFSFLGIDATLEGDALLHEYHRTAEKRVTRPFIRRLQGTGAYRVFSSVVPRRFKDKVQPLITWGIDTRRASIPESLERDLRASLVDDIAGLREFLGPQFDGWGLLDASDRRVSP